MYKRQTKISIKIYAEKIQLGGNTDYEYVRRRHDDYVAELADMQEELAALNLSPDFVEAVAAAKVKEIEEERANYAALYLEQQQKEAEQRKPRKRGRNHA